MSPRITQEEVELVKKAQAGDELAFNELFKKYKTFVENRLYSYLKDMDEAKDIANIVFLKVHDKLSSFKAYDSFGGWLRTITNHTAIDYLRELGNKYDVIGSSDDRLSSTISIGNNEPNNSMEDDIVNRLTYEYILGEIDKLPKNKRDIFILYYVDGLQVWEISEALNIPIGTVKSILYRCRRRIKQNLTTSKL